jgi:hypothetical protein
MSTVIEMNDDFQIADFDMAIEQFEEYNSIKKKFEVTDNVMKQIHASYLLQKQNASLFEDYANTKVGTSTGADRTNQNSINEQFTQSLISKNNEEPILRQIEAEPPGSTKIPQMDYNPAKALYTMNNTAFKTYETYRKASGHDDQLPPRDSFRSGDERYATMYPVSNHPGIEINIPDNTAEQQVQPRQRSVRNSSDLGVRR